MPAIGNAARMASTASGPPSTVTDSLRPATAATARSRSSSTGPMPASATATASRPSRRQVGAGFISVPQRSTPYRPSAAKAVSRTSGRSPTRAAGRLGPASRPREARTAT